MFVFIVIGKKRSGKSTVTKELCETFKHTYAGSMYFLDVMNEYTSKFGFVNAYKGQMKHEDFLNSVSSVTNSFVVFEEAAYYFSAETNKKLKDSAKEFTQQTRHTNNCVVLIFHSISDMPSFLYNRADYLFLFKTNDTSRALGSLSNNEQFLEAYQKVKNHPDKHYFEVIDVT